MLKPSALTATVAMLLKAGTKQTLVGATYKETVGGTAATVNASQLLEVIRNLGDAGTEADAGTTILPISRQLIDVLLPDWHTASCIGYIRHFISDPKDPKTFYVYPKASSSPAMYVEVAVSRVPTEIAALADTIDSGLDDMYENSLIDYVLYRAYSKDSEFTPNAERAQRHYQLFQQSLGIKLQNEVAMSAGATTQPKQ